VRFVGIDLAWSLRKTRLPDTGGVVLSDSGRVITHEHLTSDDSIVAFILENTDATGCIVGIDAPLVVPNATGRRVCEAALQAVGISSYPANRTLFDRNCGGVRGENLVAQLGEYDFILRAEIGKGETQKSLVEVYPRALIRRIWGRIPPYKSGAHSNANIDIASGMQELQRLILEQSDPPLYWERPPISANTVATLRPRQLKRSGDLLDAALSAYLGYLAWFGGPDRVETVGTITDGFIMLPRSPIAEKSRGSV